MELTSTESEKPMPSNSVEFFRVVAYKEQLFSRLELEWLFTGEENDEKSNLVGDSKLDEEDWYFSGKKVELPSFEDDPIFELKSDDRFPGEKLKLLNIEDDPLVFKSDNNFSANSSPSSVNENLKH